MTAPAPTTAERIRSTCARATGAMLAIEGVEPIASAVHDLLPDASFALTVPVGGTVAGLVDAAGTAGVQAMLEMTDYAPLPLREPVRSLVWFRGRVQAVPDTAVPQLLDLIGVDADARLVLVRLEVESVVVADSTGAESVGLTALLAARPDPFCVMESCWLRHLEVAHRDVVDRLADRLPTTLRRGRIRPLGLDRYGVRMRVENDEGDHDVRLPFARPVDDITGLSQAIRILMGCPFLNGLRARRPLP